MQIDLHYKLSSAASLAWPICTLVAALGTLGLTIAYGIPGGPMGYIQLSMFGAIYVLCLPFVIPYYRHRHPISLSLLENEIRVFHSSGTNRIVDTKSIAGIERKKTTAWQWMLLFELHDGTDFYGFVDGNKLIKIRKYAQKHDLTFF